MNQNEQMQDALRQNVRAFRHSESGKIKYLLTELDDASDYEDVMIIPNLSNKIINKMLAVKPRKLVRLTEHQLEQLGCSYAEDFDFANAIMDALIKKNGGAA